MGGMVLTQYGNVTLLRAMCPVCKRMALVLDGNMACCDLHVSNDGKIKQVRMSVPPNGRRTPSKKEAMKILKYQEHRCLYCELRFGSTVYRCGKPCRLRVNWDHLIPYVYSQNNQVSNFAAACQICNHMKSSYIFQTLEEARIHVNAKREKKGYTTEAGTDLSCLRRVVPATS